MTGQMPLLSWRSSQTSVVPTDLEGSITQVATSNAAERFTGSVLPLLPWEIALAGDWLGYHDAEMLHLTLLGVEICYK